MSALLFYHKTVALNKQLHGNMRVTPPNAYFFAAQTNSVPLAGKEFGEACKEYAIVFSKTEGGSLIPVVLLGVRSNENLFLNKENKWRAAYIPAFVRRYPFVLASDPDNTQALTVCIDAAYPGFGSEVGEFLFDEKGEYTSFFRRTLTFLQDCHNNFKLTELLAKKLQQLDILKAYSAKFDLKSGKSFSLGEVAIVDEEKLKGIGDKDALDLVHSGQLAWIYFHLASLTNLARLVDMASEQL